MKNLLVRMFSRTNSVKGYTIVELAVSTSIIAMLAVGGLSVMKKKTESDRYKTTIERMDKIEKAIAGFIRVKQYIPCPALPNLLETNKNFGKSEGMQDLAALTIYDPTTKTCSLNGLLNKTGAVPVKILNLPNEYSYDGWERKFTFRIADEAGSKNDFMNVGFRGNIRVINLKGANKTSIDEPSPNNNGAVFVLISHGANGKDAAWRKNYDYSKDGADPVPGLTGGVERQNTNHANNIYIQNDKTQSFDDIVMFKLKKDFIEPKVIEAPWQINTETCEKAKALYEDGAAKLATFAARGSTYSDHSEKIMKAAEAIVNLCDYPPPLPSYDVEKLSGLKLWLDATDAATIFSASGCSGAVSAGDTVGCWKDKSTNTTNATQSSSSNRPTYQSGGINGKASLDFISSDYFNLPNNTITTGNAPYALITVVQTDELANNGIFGSGPYSNNAAIIMQLRNDGKLRHTWFNYDLDSTSALIIHKPYILSFVYDGSTGKQIYINGALDGYLSYDSRNGGGTTTTIGVTNGSEYFDGDMGEIIVSNAALSGPERSDAEIYLSNKWGVSLTKSEGTESICSSGMTYMTTDSDPIGGCHCPDGQQLVTNLTSGNACNSNNEAFGVCAEVETSPLYDSPPTTTNMELWLDANDCTTISLDDGSKINQWTDKSPALNNVTQSSTAKPVYQKNVLNSKNVVRFTNDSLVKSSFSTLNNASVFIAGAITSGSFFNIAPNSSSTDLSLYNGSGVVRLLPYSGATAFTSTVSTPVTGIFTAELDNTNDLFRLYYNGSLTKELSLPASLNSSSYLSVGNAQSSYLDGDIAEMIVYSGALSSNDRYDTEKYMADKWGITLKSKKTCSTVSCAGMQLWLDANDSTTMFTGEGCNTAQPSDAGDLIGCWQDKSGNKNDATQGTDNYKPTYQPEALTESTMPAVRFDGTDDIFSTDLSSISGSNYSIVAATMRSSNKSSNFFIGNYDAVTNKGLYFGYLYNGTFTLAQFGNNINVVINNYEAGKPAISIGTFDYNVGHKIRVMETAQWEEATNTEKTGFISNVNGQVGGALTARFSGDIAELLVYNRVLTETEQTAFENYFSNKWGIELPPPPVGPANINEGIRIWLDASSLSDMYISNTCSGTNVASVNDAVGCWKDKSNNSRHATQSNSSYKPVYKTVTSRNAVYFAADPTRYLVSDGVASSFNAEFTAITAIRPEAATAENQYFVSTHNGGNNRRLFGIDTSGYFLYHDDTGGDQSLDNTDYYGTSLIYTLTKSGSNITLSLNGTEKNTITDGISSTDLNQFSIGQEWDGGTPSNEYKGYIHEMAVYNRLLSSAEISSVENLYSDNWNIVVLNGPAGKTDGISLWLNAAANDSIYSTAGFPCTGAVADGGSVTCWADKSGNAKHAIQSVALNKPVWGTDLINSRKVLKFDSSDSLKPSLSGYANSLFVVFKPASTINSSTGGDIRLINFGDNSGTPYSLSLGVSTGHLSDEIITMIQGASSSNRSGWTSSSESISSTDPTMLSVIYDSSTPKHTIYVNGAEKTLATSGTPGLQSWYPTTSSIGQEGNGFTGDIAEVASYTTVLNVGNRKAIESELATRWNVTLPFTPLKISNLKLWLDASQQSTIFTDSSCSTNVTASNDAVGCWQDISGNGSNNTQSPGSNQPSYQKSVLNLKSVIRFGGDDFLNANMAILTGTNYTLGAVITRNSNKTVNYFLGNNNSGTNNGALHFGWRTSTAFTLDQYGTANPDLTVDAYTAPETHIAIGWFDSAVGHKVRILDGGTWKEATNADTASFVSNTNGQIGRGYDASSWFNGDIAEIVIYKKAVTSQEQNNLECYFSTQWNQAAPGC